jgi:hypothetical protein
MIRFSDVYVSTMARGLCAPNEQFIAAGAGSRQSFWTFKIPWFRHAYLLLATSDRLLVIDHRKGLIFDRMDKVESYRWSDIGSIKLGGFFTRKLVVKDLGNRTLLEMKLPKWLANPLTNNASGLSTLVQTWEQRRVLGAAPAFGQLPPQQAYAAHAYAPAPQAYNQAPPS